MGRWAKWLRSGEIKFVNEELAVDRIARSASGVINFKENYSRVSLPCTDPNVSHPFVLAPPLDPRTMLPPRAEFHVDLALSVRGLDYLPHFVAVFEGGATVGHFREACRLLAAPPEWTLAAESSNANRLRLEFLTPNRRPGTTPTSANFIEYAAAGQPILAANGLRADIGRAGKARPQARLPAPRPLRVPLGCSFSAYGVQRPPRYRRHCARSAAPHPPAVRSLRRRPLRPVMTVRVFRGRKFYCDAPRGGRATGHQGRRGWSGSGRGRPAAAANSARRSQVLGSTGTPSRRRRSSARHSGSPATSTSS